MSPNEFEGAYEKVKELSASVASQNMEMTWIFLILICTFS